MTGSQSERPRLAVLARTAAGGPRRIEDASRRADLGPDAPTFTAPGAAALKGASVLLRTPDQLTTALSLLVLDGVARRMVLCPPDLEDEDLPRVCREAEIDVVVGTAPSGCGVPAVDLAHPPRQRQAALEKEPLGPSAPTEWVLFTSGTTGRPKMVVHTLEGLTGAIPPPPPAPPVWATFYDIRRYGGLQMLLRALTSGGSMILSSPGEGPVAFLRRLAAGQATHIAGTPSHWRQALLAGEIDGLRPQYVRLSGEIADQGIIDRLKARFPGVPVVHAYASTEGGVGFEVADGLEGFPQSVFSAGAPGVEMKVQDGVLRVRSGRTARRFLPDGAAPLVGTDGYVDTGDRVELCGGRWRFLGRRGGVVNVGGHKVHPEEVEAVINRQPGVRGSRVSGRRNPVTGAVVVAEVTADPGVEEALLETALRTACAAALAPFKRPAVIRFVPDLEVTAGGKLRRADA